MERKTIEKRLRELLPYCEIQIWQPTQYVQIDITSGKNIELTEEALEALEVISLSFRRDHIAQENKVTVKVKNAL